MKTKALALLGMVGLAAGTAQAGDSKVLIIDQGADLQHEKIANLVNENQHEKNGTSGVDDDKDGFIDDISGWNAVSNDSIYMPDYLLNFFKEDPVTIKQALDLYTKVENGDAAAREELMNNPMMMQIVSTVLDLSHGTHVAGIAAKLGEGTGKLQSLNVFLPSKQDGVSGGGSSVDPTGNPSALARSIIDVRPLLSDLIRKMTDDDKPVETTTVPPSFLDGPAAVDELLKNVEIENGTRYELLSRYVKASQADVVNLSLGIAKHQLSDLVDQLWRQELVERGMPMTTARDAKQQVNFDRLVNGLFTSQHKGWLALFKGNPNTVFVIAAGNEGDTTNPDKGNLDKFPITPSMTSTEVPNVITVVATTQTGVIADFSNFSATKANIGAWGVAVPSLAPGNNYVAMSGTSMAAPFVTGVVAKIRSLNNKLTPADVRKIVEKTGTQVGSLKGKCTSNGVINPVAAYAASTEALNGLGVDLAISKVVKLRDPFGIRGGIHRGRGIMLDPATRAFSNPSMMDVNSVGKVFRTSAAVKHFIRH